jgi:surface polysaccharide O-acyltransferase-like enzyme
MDIMYGKYQFLATGGAIGDALFFFCSGFVLFLGRIDRFDNWYKKRINRIYPSIFAWALIKVFLGLSFENLIEIIVYGGGWFVSCIMIHYIVLYIIRKYMINHLKLVFLLICFIIGALYLFEDRPNNYFMYGGYVYTYFRWCYFFIFTLFGAIVGNTKKEQLPRKRNVIYLTFSIFAYYGILYLSQINTLANKLQIISLMPLLLICLYFYYVCNTRILKKLYKTKYIGFIMNSISVLTLEIYIVQYAIITDKLNYLFPINIIIVFVIIVIVAYLTKTIGKIILQTFYERSYNWRNILNIK